MSTNATITIPAAAMKYFRLTGAMGGKRRAALHSKAELSRWGKLGGRPRKDGAKPGTRRARRGGK